MSGMVAILPNLKEVSVGRASASNQAMLAVLLSWTTVWRSNRRGTRALAGAEVIGHQENNGKERPKDE